MVLEQLFSLPLIEKKPWYALFIGFTYTVIGLGLAVWIFGEDPALVAVAFTALLLFPTLRRLLHEPKSKEQIQEKIAQKIKLGSTVKQAKVDLSKSQFHAPLIHRAHAWMRGSGQIKVFLSTFGEIMGIYFGLEI